MEAPAGYKIIRHFDFQGPFSLSQAKNERDRRIVTLKSPRNTSDEKAVLYLEKEFENLEDIQRGPALAAQRFIRDINQPTLILDEMPGQTMNSMCHSPADLARFLTLAASCAQNLALLHESGYLHLNLTPSNILVTKDLDAVRFTGLGDAQPIKNPDFSEIRRRDFYELHYIAPEQTGQLDQTPDVRSDIYSLGACLYHFLMGISPFEAEDELGAIHSHMAKAAMPPHEMRTLPRTISDIVMKCLEKNAEDRYQTAHSLMADLSKCLRLWRETKTIAPFELGEQKDFLSFQVSHHIYGREAETRTLFGALQQAQQKKKQLVSICGQPGIGKTTLVGQVKQKAIEQGFYFVQGKHDQIRQNTPYVAIIQGLKGLIQQLLTEDNESIERWKNAICEALGSNLGLITEVLPELETITGPAAKPSPMPAAQAQHRFRSIFVTFLELFASNDHKMVLFIDDMQWVDKSSLTLLNMLANTANEAALLIIYSYRINEVGSNHELIKSFEDIQRDRIFVNQINLEPLGENSLNQLISDTLSKDEDACLELTQVVIQKTNGNPFFVGQFLQHLHDDGLIHFDKATHGWDWDIEPIAVLEVSANVVELVRQIFTTLPDTTQKVLAYAGFLGNNFIPELLAIAMGVPLSEVENAIEHAIERQLLFAVVEDNFFGQDTFYKFSHDRIQQAACQYISNSKAGEVHLEMGRNLLAKLDPEQLDEHLFLVAAQFQLGAGLVSDPEERYSLAKLFTDAGERAKMAAAFDAAKVYYQNAERLLDATYWSQDYDFCFSLNLALAESCYMSGDFSTAQHQFDILLQRSQNQEDKAQVYSLLILFYIHQSAPDRALQAGRECLALFDIYLPIDPMEIEERLYQEIDEIHVNMGHKTPEDLLLLPELSDQSQLPALRLLVSLYASTYQTDILMHCLIGAFITNISIKHGNSSYSALGYLTYGSMLCSRFGDIRTGYAFGKLALSMAQQKVANTPSAPIKYSFASFISPWARPIKECANLLYSAYNESHRAADMIFAAMSLSFLFRVLILKGDPIDQILEEWRRLEDAVQSLKYREISDAFNVSGHFLLALKGETESSLSLSTENFSESALISSLKQSVAKSGSQWFWVCKSKLAYLNGNFDAALEAATEAESLNDAAFGQPAVAEQQFYMALILSARCREASKESQNRFIAQIDAIIERLKNWSELAPENFLHQYLLVAAEKAQVLGRRHMAIELYTQAIKAAKEAECLHNAAIANELTGQEYFKKGLESMAKAYILEAHQLYSRWGARTKVIQLEKRYSDIFGTTQTSMRSTGKKAATHDTEHSLDMEALMKAAQAISSEIVLENLLAQLITVMMEAAGAEKGFIILNNEGVWQIEAEAYTKRDTILVLQHERFERSTELSTSMVNYVIRTQEPVHIGNAAEDQLFSSDPYMQDHKVKSVYCHPIIKQNTAMGVVYLENDLVSNAFTPKRQTTLEFLTAQAAVSLENALLYASLKAEVHDRQQAETQVRKLNEELEQRVERRTAQLAAANEELEAFSYSVSHDLRAPLRTIKGFTEALEEDYVASLDESAQDYITRIHNAVDNMEELISGMLQLSRASRGELLLEQVNLSAIVSDISQRHTDQNDPSSIHFTIEPNIAVLGSYGLLRSVMENLVENAVKFTAGCNPAEIEFGSFEQDDEVIYYLKDNGVGFSMDYADKLFGAFQRLHSDAEFEGTGIGLATVQRIIHRHGGRIWARGQESEGACFYFTLACEEA